MLGDFASLDVQNTYRGSDAYVEKIYLNYKEIYDSLYFNKNPKLTKEQFRNRIYYFDLYQQDETLLTEVSLSFRQMIRKSYGKEIFDNFGKNLKLCEQIKNKCEQITNKDKVLISTLKDILKKVIKCRKSLGDKLIPEVNIESLKTTGAVKKEIDHQIQKMEIDVYGYKI
ncbi:hypothetical protein PsalMR5_00060 [Piscirickettsia salmonis]|nr:hypothetical protein PsalSR1_00060 [Piscirickettsia salmonis]QGP62243.1 hypothetical protein PsalMR5_00060 [Piscirickettsia salmonis]